MLAHNDLQRSIRAMTIGMARSMDKRSHEADRYGLGEREQQYQYELVGQAGVLPVETVLTVRFGVAFVADAGNQRDSQLDRPQVRIGFEVDFAPPGFVPYAYVSSWKQDNDFNFIGANVTAGGHCPAVAIEGMNVSQARFKYAVHLGFQGYASVIDPDGNFDGGGQIDLPAA